MSWYATPAERTGLVGFCGDRQKSIMECIATGERSRKVLQEFPAALSRAGLDFRSMAKKKLQALQFLVERRRECFRARLGIDVAKLGIQALVPHLHIAPAQDLTTP
jgi:hypothetical protein